MRRARFLPLALVFLALASPTTPARADLLNCVKVGLDGIKIEVGGFKIRIAASHARKILRKAKAQELAKLIAVDEESARLVSNPEVASYIYLNYFAEKTGLHEVRAALKDLAESTAGNEDLFDLTNVKLAARLQDPEVRARVREAFAENDSLLRPGKLNADTFNQRATLRQALAVVPATKRLHKMVAEGMSQEVMDRSFWDFYGATQLGIAESQLRPWDIPQGSFAAVRPNQVVDITPDMWAKFARFAAEIEAPIHGYSTNSGDYLRALMPSLSKFMGKTIEETQAFDESVKGTSADTVAERKRSFCSAIWCKEENRHDTTLSRLADQIEGRTKEGPMTYEADALGDPFDADAAILHVAGRNSSEWNANSVYFFLRAHSKGAAHQYVDQVRKDETKHMAIFSAAYKYIFGDQPNKRTKEMLQKIKKLAEDAKTQNSNGSIIGGSKSILLEFLATHVFVEHRVRKYFESVPLKTMAKFFEPEVKTIKEIPSAPIPPEKQAKIDAMIIRERESRARLERWKPAQREEYLALKKVEQEHEAVIGSLIVNVFHEFKGAEIPGSSQHKAMLKRIDRVKLGIDQRTDALIRKSLRETLRDYQIMNNSFVRSRPDLVVKFKNAQEGFIVDYADSSTGKVLLAEKVNDTSYLLRVEKPANLGTLQPGQPMLVTLDTPKGPQTRMLSLASAPGRNYLEFAVRDSDSEFKKAFRTLKEGTVITVEEPPKVHMAFDEQKPAVMIAGGIGITPFRSFIQHAADQKLETPLYLLYGNRDQIAFGQELDQTASANSSLKVQHVLSKPEPGWPGSRGRIDDAYLANMLPSLPNDAVFYVVGPPGMVTGAEAALIKLGIPKERIKIEVFPDSSAGAPLFEAEQQVARKRGAKEEEEPLCRCHNVTAAQILASGATTLGEVEDATKAGTGCGGCRTQIDLLLRTTAGVRPALPGHGTPARHPPKSN